VSTDVAPSSPSVGLSTFSQGHKHGNSQGRHRRSSASQSRVSQPSGWVSHPHTLTHTHPHKDHNWRTQGRSSREIEIDLTLCVDVEILMKPGAEHAPGRMNVLKVCHLCERAICHVQSLLYKFAPHTMHTTDIFH
jgi:hypothetical protein